MKSLCGYAPSLSSLSSPHENGAQMANKFKSTADLDSLSRQLAEQEASPGSRPSQARDGNRKVPEKSFLKFVRDPRQRAVPSRREEKQGELPGNWNSVTSVDSLQLNSRCKPATVRCAASGQAQLPDSLSQAGAGSSNIISRRGVSTSQNAGTVLGPESEAARPGGSRSRHLEADPLEGFRRNGRTKTRQEVSEQPNLASAERDSPDEEARHSAAFANQSPSSTGSLATEARQHRMMGRKPQTRLTFGRSDGVEACDKKYENQLERFLGALMQADHRLIGADAGHRIQIADCSLDLEGELGVGEFIEYVHGRLDAVLFQRDRWENRFKELEAFVEENRRLPRQRGAGCDRAEVGLSIWLKNQGKTATSQQMPAHRLERLLTARFDLIRRRVEGWMTRDIDGRFQQKCRELKEYIGMNGKLPTKRRKSSSNWVGRWFADLRAKGSYDAKPERRKMLEEVDPLVKELLQKWDHAPFKINRARWEKQLEKVLHIVKKRERLPKAKTEKPEHDWFKVQLRRLNALPPELAEQLRDSHPLIAEAARRSEQKENGTKARQCEKRVAAILRGPGCHLPSCGVNLSVPWCVC
ncbi:unnamed protein product, partial [Durusdinium trenchii]